MSYLIRKYPLYMFPCFFMSSVGLNEMRERGEKGDTQREDRNIIFPA